MNRPIHFEIVTANPEKVVEFYKSVFDWDVATWEGPQAYWLLTTGKEGTLGINGAVMHKHFDQAVINTIEVDSLSDTLQRLEAAGGEQVHGPNEIPGVGLHSYCKDPDGNMFGVLESSEV